MASVTLRIYDLSMGMAAQMSQALIGKQIDYIPHTGIVVYGVEYFFGGGIQKMPPAQVESTFGLRPVKTEVLGTTDITQDVFHTFLAGISSRFTPETYDLFNNNCNNFSDEASKFLLGRGIPADIINLPQDFLATPMGQMLRPMLSQTQDQLNSQFEAQGARMTFGDTAPAAATPTPAPAAAAGSLKKSADGEDDKECSTPPTFSSSSALMTVKVKGSGESGSKDIQVPTEGTVDDLMGAIAYHMKCKKANQRLIFLGKILKDGAKRLDGLAITEGKTILLSRRGGATAGSDGKPAASSSPSPATGTTTADFLRGMDATHNLEQAMGLIRGHDSKEQALKAVNTLIKICDNVISHPSEEKYRSIKKSNDLLRRRVGIVPGALNAIECLGFRDSPDGESLTLVASARAWEILTQGKEKLVRLRAELQQPAAPAMPNLFGGGAGGMPDLSSVMQMAASNPEMLQGMMNNPMVQQMMGSNPMMAAQMQQMMQNPQMMQQAIQMMQQNPQMMQQAQQMMGGMNFGGTNGMFGGGTNGMFGGGTNGMFGGGMGGTGASPTPRNSFAAGGGNQGGQQQQGANSAQEAEELAAAIARSLREQ